MSGRPRGKNPYARPDRFTQRAKEEGYEARSVFKLAEIQQRARLLGPGQAVLDLGCSPGSWSRYAAKEVGRRGVVVGVDLTEVADPVGPVLVRSVLEVTDEELLAALGRPPDVVLSDMAPLTTGDTFGDHVRQLELARAAALIAQRLLRPGGAFVVKVFDGEEVPDFLASLRPDYREVRRVRPEAVRQASREFFLVALGRKG
jgi:23S rRNA (uridine2552-2'-O)-methyltransferase